MNEPTAIRQKVDKTVAALVALIESGDTTFLGTIEEVVTLNVNWQYDAKRRRIEMGMLLSRIFELEAVIEANRLMGVDVDALGADGK